MSVFRQLLSVAIAVDVSLGESEFLPVVENGSVTSRARY
jgi:hypothetical protein